MGLRFMLDGIHTPLGKIEIYVDGVLKNYEFESHQGTARVLQEHPVAASYRIIISGHDWHTVRCVIVLEDDTIPNDGATGERYLYAEFVKDNIAVTIGAGDEIPDFETNRTRYGVEYIRKGSIEEVMFGVAWTEDYESPNDIRTQLATDLY